MSELVVQFPLPFAPTVDLRDGAAVLRWAYNRAFLDSDGVPVQAGTQSTGFGVEVACSIASGLITVDEDSTLWTTDDAQDPSPSSIWISAWLLTPRGVLIAQLTIAGKTQFIVTESLTPTCTWEAFSNYNQAVTVYGSLPSTYYTAAETNRVIDQSFDTHPASDIALGTVYTSVEPSQPTAPVAWITDDPLVRDAVKLQGIDLDSSTPSDGQLLSYNQASNEVLWSTPGFGTGNVTSNEVVSVDSEIALFSGTGGKTIKRGSQTGLLRGTAGVVAASTVGTTDIDAAAVTLAKVQNIATDSLIGRDTAASGVPENILLNATLSMDGSANLQRAALTGDVTASAGSNATTIANNAVTNAKAADVPTATFKGRTTASTGDPEDLTATQATALLNNMVGDSGSGGTKGLAPAPAAGDAAAGKFLKADGTYAAPSGTGAPSSATYITQIADSGLSAEQALSTLSTGLMRVATTTGVITSITDSAGLAANISDETGSGALVFGTSPTITTPVLTSPQASLTAAHGSDDTYTGLTIAGLNAGATIAQWEPVYLGGASTWLLADANGSGTYPARGLAVAAYVNTNPAVILTYGTVRNDAFNFTPGGALYLSGTAGAITQTAPSTSGDIVQVIGYALTADIIFVDMNSTYLTVT